MESQTPTPKRYFIKTFGCQMNVADSERMGALLEERGMQATEDASDADVILINGCTVREKAVHKAVSTLGEYQAFKKTPKGSVPAKPRKKPIIGIGGCVGQLEKDQLFKRAPYLDFVFGTDQINEGTCLTRLHCDFRHDNRLRFNRQHHPDIHKLPRPDGLF